MNFYVAMRDLGELAGRLKTWDEANSESSNYVFCGDLKGTLPSKAQLKEIYNNLSVLNDRIVNNGGHSAIETTTYWASDYYSYGSSQGHYVVDMATGNEHWGEDYLGIYVRPILTSW